MMRAEEIWPITNVGVSCGQMQRAICARTLSSSGRSPFSIAVHWPHCIEAIWGAPTMKGAKPGPLSTEQMVRRFVDIALRQYKADLGNDVKSYNKLYGQMEELTLMLKAYPDDRRRALMSIFNHPNPHVRMKAAVNTLAIDHQAARRVLEAVAASGQYPTAGRAGMTLDALDRGIFKPT